MTSLFILISSLTGGNNINHTLNSSIEENGTVANNSVQNVSMASNSSWSNDTQANQSASQNSSVEGKTTNACYKTTYIYKRAFVTSFELSYSDNAIDWKKVHEGGNVKVRANATRMYFEFMGPKMHLF